MDSAGERFEAIRAALADRNNILTVKDLCELAGVSRSGYYNWVRSEKNRALREAKDRAAFEQILEAYRFRGYAKGVRGIHMRLLHMGNRMNVKKIRRLMRKYKLTCPIRKPNPYALQEIMRRFALRPAELLMVDDMKNGYDMARACGVPFACAGWSHSDPMIIDFMRQNSDFYFETVTAFEAFLFGQKQT